MTTAAAHELELREPRLRPARRKKAAQRGFLGGVMWIIALGLLLAGVVALNVAVLQLNVRLDQLGRDRAQLRAGNATLAAQLSSAAATPQVEALAQKRLGLVPAAPELTTYVELERRR